MGPRCFGCKHYLAALPGVGYICRAFPRGIPSTLMAGQIDHLKPLEGDHAIQFELREGDDASTAVPEER